MASSRAVEAADPFEAERLRDRLAKSAGALQGIAGLLLLAGIAGAVVFFWSAWSEDFDVLGGGSLDGHWDWWRGAWSLAVGLFSFGVLHGLASVLSWLSWKADEALPVPGLVETDVWKTNPRSGESGTAKGQGM